jgi:site-specific DNA recombinase
MKGRVEKDIVLINDKLTELQQETSPFKLYIQKEIPMLENILKFYRKSDGATKKKILSTIFAEKLVLEKGKVVDPVFTEPVKLTFFIKDTFQNSIAKDKNALLENEMFFKMSS